MYISEELSFILQQNINLHNFQNDFKNIYTCTFLFTESVATKQENK